MHVVSQFSFFTGFAKAHINNYSKGMMLGLVSTVLASLLWGSIAGWVSCPVFTSCFLSPCETHGFAAECLLHPVPLDWDKADNGKTVNIFVKRYEEQREAMKKAEEAGVEVGLSIETGWKACESSSFLPPPVSLTGRKSYWNGKIL